MLICRIPIQPKPLRYFPKAHIGQFCPPYWFSFIVATDFDSDTQVFIRPPFQIGETITLLSDVKDTKVVAKIRAIHVDDSDLDWRISVEIATPAPHIEENRP